MSGFVGSQNLGDEAVFLALVEELAKRVPGAVFTVVSVNVERTRQLLQTRANDRLNEICVVPRRWLPLAIARHDVCIFGGGGIIQDQSSILNLIYFLVQIQFAKVLGKKVGLAFVGIGPLKSRFGRSWTSLVLSNVDLCIVRDEGGAQLLRNIGLTNTEVITASDIALNLGCRRAHRTPHDQYLLLSLRHWYQVQAGVLPASVRARIADTLDVLLEHLARELNDFLLGSGGFRVLAVPCFGQRDAMVHRWLRDKLRPECQERFHLHDPVSDPCQYAVLARSARCVVGMRLHSLILASLHAVPMVALSYSPKVAAFMAQLGLEEQVIDIASTPEITGFAYRLERALRDAGEMRAQIRRRQQELARSNESALSRLVEVLSGREP